MTSEQQLQLLRCPPYVGTFGLFTKSNQTSRGAPSVLATEPASAWRPLTAAAEGRHVSRQPGLSEAWLS